MAFTGFITAAALSAKEKTMNDKPTARDPVSILTELDVAVTMGPVFKDAASKPLTRQGAQTIVNHLRASGFKIVEDSK